MCTKRDLVHRCASNFCCDASFAALLHTLAEEYCAVPEPSLTLAKRVSRGEIGVDRPRLSIHVPQPVVCPTRCLQVSMASSRCPSCRIVANFASRHFQELMTPHAGSCSSARRQGLKYTVPRPTQRIRPMVASMQVMRPK